VTVPLVDFGVFDADNHYYEPMDAFTRYVEPEFADRTMRWAKIDGRTRLIVGGRVNHYMSNPTFDPVSRPGWLDAYFRGLDPEGASKLMEQLDPIATRPEYRDRDARLKVMDAQGIEAAFFFPTLAVGMERVLTGDAPALMAAFRAFNRWVDEDWGFNYKDRIFAAPFISLVDVDNAVRELEAALARDARLVLITYGPITTPTGGRSPGDRIYDPFWARVNEAGIVVGMHGGDTRYKDYLADWGQKTEINVVSAMRRRRQKEERGEPVEEDPSIEQNIFRGMVSHSAIHDTMAALLAQRVFLRFPNVRVAAIETGASWVGPLLGKLGGSMKRAAKSWPEDPRDTFKRHVWVAAFGEDDFVHFRETMGGVDHMLMGSDWPHPEGYAEPTSFVNDLKQAGYTDEECRKVMRENGFDLIRSRALSGV
jgi:predicted TIM-barrel fold metal-dependent hydrolase